MSNAFDKASLVMLPHAYEEGKLYSLKPTDRSGDFTFSRGTDTATRVGEDGYIKKEYANLLEQSNSFDTTPWVEVNGTVVPNQLGYDGTNDAWQLNAVGSGNYRRILQNVNVTNVFTFSVYAKANTTNFLVIWDTVGSNRIYFDLSQTTPSNVVALQQGGIDGTPKAESVGNGWWRLSMSFNRGSTGDFWVFPVDASGNTFCTDGNGVYIQDAQINQGLVAYPYLETTTAPVYGGLTDDMPRLDYSGGATCPSLLLEPSRSNLLAQSEYYGDLALTRITLTSNYGTSPEGVQNSSAIFNTTENGRHNLNGAYFAVTSGTSYVNSVFAKAGTITKIKLRLYSGGGIDIGFNDGDFDLTNGTATGTGAGIESYGNGWYRCYVVDSPTSSVSNARFNVELLDANGGISYVGSVTDYIEIFGSQVEAGSYPTSYIPTYGSSQTRGAESCVVNGATSSIGQTEGTIFTDFVYEANGGGFYGSYVANATGFSDFVGWRVQDNKTTLDILIRYNNVYQVIDSIASVFAVGNRYKIALKYSSGDIKVFVNNQEKYSSTATYTTPSVPLSKHTISGATVNLVDSLQQDTISKVNQSILFPTALSDDECKALTQL